MANKRSTKKQIRTLCGALAGELLTASAYIDGIDTEKVAELVTRIARLQVKALSMCNFSFDKSPADFPDTQAYHKALAAYNKLAFRRLHDALNDETAAILKEMNATVKK